jgi:hypothetical protein
VPLINNNLKSFQVPGRLPQWAYWVVAAVLFGIVWQCVGLWARWAALNDLKDRVDIWNQDGTLQQQTNYTCVPSAIVMLLKDYGIDTTTYDIAVISDTDIRGTSGSGIIATAKHFGFVPPYREILTFDEFVAKQTPALIIFRRHGVRHAAYLKLTPDPLIIEVKDSVDGLLMFDISMANDWFGADKWDIYLFKR